MKDLKTVKDMYESKTNVYSNDYVEIELEDVDLIFLKKLNKKCVAIKDSVSSDELIDGREKIKDFFKQPYQSCNYLIDGVEGCKYWELIIKYSDNPSTLKDTSYYRQELLRARMFYHEQQTTWNKLAVNGVDYVLSYPEYCEYVFEKYTNEKSA